MDQGLLNCSCLTSRSPAHGLAPFTNVQNTVASVEVVSRDGEASWFRLLQQTDITRFQLRRPVDPVRVEDLVLQRFGFLPVMRTKCLVYS